MTLLLGWLLLAVAIAHFTRRWPVVAAILVAYVYILVPNQAEGQILPRYHPAAYLAITVLGYRLLTNRENEREIIGRYLWILVAALALTGYAGIDLLQHGGVTTWIGTVGRMLWIPIAVFLLLLTVFVRRPRALATFSWALILMSAFQVYLANLQHISDGRSGFWWRSYLERSWWWTDQWSIGMGTTGHPLQLGLLLAGVTPLLIVVRQVWLRFGLIALFLYGAAIATARTAIVLIAIGGAYIVLRSSRRVFATAVGAIVAVPLAQYFLNTTAADSTLSKFQSDGGSAQLRGDARIWAWAHRDEFMFFGYPGGRDVRASGILGSSLENGYLMVGLQFGLVLAAAIGVFHLVLIFKPWLGRPIRLLPYFLSAFFLFVGLNGSSSFMAQALEGTTFWMFLAMLHGAAYAVSRGLPLPGEKAWGSRAGELESSADEEPGPVVGSPEGADDTDAVGSDESPVPALTNWRDRPSEPQLA